MASTGKAQDGPPDALALLRADHQQVRLLFAQCERLRGVEDVEETLAELVDDLCDALIVHTMLEEELFYPALRAATGDDELFDDAELEHAGARELISQLEVMYPGDEHFEATLAVLAEEVAHHIAQEEDEMFELARTAGVDLRALGQRLALRHAQLEDDMSAPPAFAAAPVPLPPPLFCALPPELPALFPLSLLVAMSFSWLPCSEVEVNASAALVRLETPRLC